MDERLANLPESRVQPGNHVRLRESLEFQPFVHGQLPATKVHQQSIDTTILSIVRATGDARATPLSLFRLLPPAQALGKFSQFQPAFFGGGEFGLGGG